MQSAYTRGILAPQKESAQSFCVNFDWCFVTFRKLSIALPGSIQTSSAAEAGGLLHSSSSATTESDGLCSGGNGFVQGGGGFGGGASVASSPSSSSSVFAGNRNAGANASSQTSLGRLNCANVQPFDMVRPCTPFLVSWSMFGDSEETSTTGGEGEASSSGEGGGQDEGERGNSSVGGESEEKGRGGGKGGKKKKKDEKKSAKKKLVKVKAVTNCRNPVGFFAACPVVQECEGIQRYKQVKTRPHSADGHCGKRTATRSLVGGVQGEYQNRAHTHTCIYIHTSLQPCTSRHLLIFRIGTTGQNTSSTVSFRRVCSPSMLRVGVRLPSTTSSFSTLPYSAFPKEEATTERER